MSTHKTQNYGLHAWVPGDNFLRTEFNENFALLDQSARVVFGTYQGTRVYTTDSREQYISLGFHAKAVLVFPGDGNLSSHEAGLAFRETPTQYGSTKTLEIDETGFWVRDTTNGNGLNSGNTTYYYIAFR